MRLTIHRLALLVVAVSLAATGVAFAAGVALTPAALTVHAGPTVVAPSSCTIAAPVADTYADEGSLLDSFGAATTLHVRSGTTLILLPANKRTFVRFDVSSCGIAPEAEVLDAKLKLFLSSAPSSSRTYRAHRITTSWSEASVTWNQQPSVATPPSGSVSTGTASNVSLEWDVRQDVQRFVAGSLTNHGWRVSDAVENDAGEGRFNSREHSTASQRPSLVVTYYP